MASEPDREVADALWSRLLRAASVGCFLLALIAVVVRGRAVGTLLVTLLIGVPIVRVAWLAWSWRRGDALYAAAAAGLLAIMLLGALAAAALR